MLGAPHVASPLFNKGLSCRAARLCAKGKGSLSLSLSLPQLLIFASPVDPRVFADCHPSVHRDGNVVKVY